MKSQYAPLWLSGILYGVSLFLPPFVLKEGNSGFILGFVCLFFGFGHLAWLANPIYFASLLTLAVTRKIHVSAILSIFAFAIALLALTIAELPRNEAGQMTQVAGYGPAFYLWLASMLVIPVAAVRKLMAHT